MRIDGFLSAISRSYQVDMMIAMQTVAGTVAHTAVAGRAAGMAVVVELARMVAAGMVAHTAVEADS